MSRRRRLFSGKRRATKGRGRTDPRIFATRHRFLLILLLAQVPALALIGLVKGAPNPEIAAGSIVLLATAVVGLLASGQLVAAGAVSIGLVTAAGILVRYLQGSPESFFAFYLALVAVSFYQEIGLLLAGLAYVVGFHVFSLMSLYRESVIFRAGVVDLSLPIAAVTLDGLLVLLLIAGWRINRRIDIRHRAAADMFRVGFQRSGVQMAVLTPSGDVIHANESLLAETGPVDGANIRSVVHSDDHDLLGQLWEDMGQAEDRSAEKWLRLRTSDGRAVWGRMSLSFIPATRERAAGILLQFEDDEAGHREQARLEALLERGHEFVAAIAEDIKEPITSILDLTTLADSDPIDLHQIVHRIDGETRRVASIVDDLLLSARGGTNTQVARSVEAALLCREALADVPGAGAVGFDPGDERIWADPSLTVRILDSLLANAVRYGGRLVSLDVTPSGPDTAISVKDDGPAVPPAERERMFDADLRAGEQPTRPASVGLSLTVARRLARQMDGDITYRRAGDGYNVFELRLPAEPLRMAVDSDMRLETIGISI
jgi:PAS domain S-box-containing protein